MIGVRSMMDRRWGQTEIIPSFILFQTSRFSPPCGKQQGIETQTEKDHTHCGNKGSCLRTFVHRIPHCSGLRKFGLDGKRCCYMDLSPCCSDGEIERPAGHRDETIIDQRISALHVHPPQLGPLARRLLYLPGDEARSFHQTSITIGADKGLCDSVQQ